MSYGAHKLNAFRENYIELWTALQKSVYIVLWAAVEILKKKGTLFIKIFFSSALVGKKRIIEKTLSKKHIFRPTA